MKKEKMPHNFWDYGINPILGYRYAPDGKSLPSFARTKKNQDVSTTIKP